ncbi:hypothetical protein F3Y22_tig00013285pilonHSYRG00098 [Hibiscus syriacus]|uniref:Ubiquitin-like protease family profile domain-containing protein n=1 Tax=Hibiscus syriacus TaxID=106335 RepID=A0A6A3C1H0_HIBSY|nr:hypothetical protein F3Y22_tig00013285pilonHSYRG00098 [Hibiscus syriacus]
MEDNTRILERSCRMAASTSNTLKDRCQANTPQPTELGVLEHSRKMVASTSKTLKDRCQANTPQPTELVGLIVWLPPPEGWNKLNTDAARRNTDGKATCGGVIRDTNGEWRVDFKKFIGIYSTMEAVLWRVYTGLLCAWEQGIQQLLVEIDSLESVQTLKNSTNKDGLLTITTHIKELINRAWTVRLQHVRREGNEVSDKLTRSVNFEDSQTRFIQEPPDDINHLLYEEVSSPSLTLYGEICPHLRRFPSPSPAKSLTTIHSQKSLTIIQKWKINLRGPVHSSYHPPIMVIQGFPDESIEKPNLNVDDMKKLFNKKDGFTRMNDVDVVRVCLLLLLYAGFLGREARQPIPQELILLVEDLNAWNLFPWGSYIWKATWTKLSSAFDDRKSLRGDGSKYTLSGFVWAFKHADICIKISDDIPRAISWKRKRGQHSINETDTPEAELATDWWQASQRFFDGTNDEQPPLPPLREPSPHPEPSPDRPDYTPLQREPSPIPSHHRVSSPPSPHDRRPTKMPRLLSPCSPPPRDESRELRDEVNALREEIGTLRDNDGAWRVEVSTLRGEVAALREMVVSLQNEVHTLRNERTDKVDVLRRVFLARQSSRIRRRARAIKSPCTPIVRRHRKKKLDSPIILKSPLLSLKRPYHSSRVPPVQEATVIVEEVPPTIQEPDSHGVICRILEKPSDVPDMMDSSWLSYELPASTIPVSEEERKQLPDTILDNTLWAKTAVDFYLHERSQGCFTDICKLNDDIYLLLDRSWWGVLLGVEDNGYFDGGKLKENKRNTRYTIMPTAFNAVHLKNQRDESFALGNGQAKLYPAWWEVDKVFIPILERNHWLLVELQIPSLKAIVYDSMINYISLADLRDIIKGWSSYLAKYLDAINYWTRSGNKKPKKLNITVSRDETAPQQTKGPRGDCGPFVCLALDRLITGSIKYLPPTDIDRAAVGLWFRHYMARSIYTRRCLPASVL